MKEIDNYSPQELKKEAEDFISLMDQNVTIYQIIRRSSSAHAAPCPEADKFAAYWSLASYNSYPHALITLYEGIDKIDESFGTVTTKNATDFLIHKLKGCYLLLKENNLIGE